MNIFSILEYIFGLVIVIYMIGLLTLWIYELKKNSLYCEMQKQIKFLESLCLNSALLQIKKYKINEDYRRGIVMVDQVQQFICENVLFIAKHDAQSRFRA